MMLYLIPQNGKLDTDFISSRDVLNSPRFYGTRGFITVLIKYLQWTLQSDTLIELANLTQCFSRIHFNIILPSILKFPILDFPTNILNASLDFPSVLYAQPISPSLI
jgi:hypothetical protein